MFENMYRVQPVQSAFLYYFILSKIYTHEKETSGKIALNKGTQKNSRKISPQSKDGLKEFLFKQCHSVFVSFTAEPSDFNFKAIEEQHWNAL